MEVEKDGTSDSEDSLEMNEDSLEEPFVESNIDVHSSSRKSNRSEHDDSALHDHTTEVEVEDDSEDSVDFFTSIDDHTGLTESGVEGEMMHRFSSHCDFNSSI